MKPAQSEDAPLKLKKRRLQGACDICRQKKVRCDSSTMKDGICSNCIAFGSECTHLHNQAKAMIKNPKGTPLEKFDGARRKVTAVLAHSYDIPKDHEDAKQAFIEIAQYVHALENQLSSGSVNLSGAASESLPSPSLGSGSSTSLNDPPAISDDVFLSEHMKRMALDQSEFRFYGKSGSLMLIKAVVELQKQYFGTKDLSMPSTSPKRPQYWSLPPWQWLPDAETRPLMFPEDDLMYHLIDLYFENANTYWPIFHRPTFDKLMAEGLHLYHYHFGATVLIMCAFASRYTDDPRVLGDGATEQNPGWQWFSQVRPIRTSFVHPPSVYELQLYCVYILTLQTTSNPDSCWVLLSNGVRLAQDVGAHRRIPGQTTPTAQSELWKRAFWALFVLDTLMSVSSGRPRATNFEDFDQDLPYDCDDEYWDHPDPEQSFKQPTGKPSKISFYLELLKLLQILAVAQRTIYAVGSSRLATEITGPYTTNDAARRIDAALNQWLDALPDHLRWDPHHRNQLFFDQSAMLITAYHDIRIVIHKPFIPSPTHSSYFSASLNSLEICEEAGRSIIDVMSIQSKRGFLPTPNIQNYLFDAALILLLSHWHGSIRGKPEDEMGLEYVRRSIAVLRTYEHRWQMAGRLCDILELLAVNGPPKPPAQTSSLKRPRPDDHLRPQSLELFSHQQQYLQQEGALAPETFDQMFQYPVYDDSQFTQPIPGPSSSYAQPRQIPAHYFNQSIIQPQHFDTMPVQEHPYVFDSNATGMWAKPGLNPESWFS